jgi:predicted acetyltransferase
VTEPYVRILEDDELTAASQVVSQGMLASLSPEVTGAWVPTWDATKAHGAFTADGRLVGIARWFEDEVSVPGTSLPAAGITSVAVLSNHRRRGHLTRLMHAQLAHARDAGMAMATLVAAEWPIYGRYGYGPAMDGCSFSIDSGAARFRDEPTGEVELVAPSELRPHLEALHRARWDRSPGSLRRPQPWVWDRMAGIDQWPGDSFDLGKRRGAIWRDAAGVVRGAVAYKIVDDGWVHNRPAGKLETVLLVGETPEAERELWRHLCEVDWATTVVGELRAVDDPLPLFLTDARMAAPVDQSDAIWVRLLDVPACFAARRAPVAGRAVIEVHDPFGFAGGRWAIEVGPEGGFAATTTEPAEVELSIGTLGALYFGGHTPRRFAEAGLLTELGPGAADRLGTLLATPSAPWSTTHY